jgi:hypothetical protein
MLQNVLSVKKFKKLPNDPVGSYLFNELKFSLQMLNAQKCQKVQKIPNHSVGSCLFNEPNFSLMVGVGRGQYKSTKCTRA